MMHTGYGSPRAGSTRRNRALAPVAAFAAALAGCTAAPQAAHAPATAQHDVPVRGSAGSSARVAGAPAGSNVPVGAAAQTRGAAGLEQSAGKMKGGASQPSPAPEPAIYSVRATPGIVHGGDKVRWDIRTSPDIVSVAAHVSAVTLPMYRLSAGHFGLTFAVPSGVPFFFHGVYTCDVRALTASGETLHRDIELTFN